MQPISPKYQEKQSQVKYYHTLQHNRSNNTHCNTSKVISHTATQGQHYNSLQHKQSAITHSNTRTAKWHTNTRNELSLTATQGKDSHTLQHKTKSWWTRERQTVFETFRYPVWSSVLRHCWGVGVLETAEIIPGNAGYIFEVAAVVRRIVPSRGRTITSCIHCLCCWHGHLVESCAVSTICAVFWWVQIRTAHYPVWPLFSIH